jgi:hypothetical protein
MKYNLTDQQINELIEQGKDFCDYFEHVLLSMGIHGRHSLIGCLFCAKEKKDEKETI